MSTQHSPGNSDEVSLFMFMENVSPMILDKWKRIGIAVGVSQAQINAIDAQHCGDTLNCFAEIFTCWQQRCCAHLNSQ